MPVWYYMHNRLAVQIYKTFVFFDNKSYISTVANPRITKFSGDTVKCSLDNVGETACRLYLFIMFF